MNDGTHQQEQRAAVVHTTIKDAPCYIKPTYNIVTP